MKNNIYLLLFLLICSYANAQIVNIPDVNFKAALLSHNPIIDLNGDGEIQMSEAAIIDGLDVEDKNISSVEGIQYFTSLVNLKCRNNQIKYLDLSNNQLLEFVSCYLNQIETLDFLNNPNLKILYCFDNPLQILNVTANPNLEKLYSHECQLKQLDVTNNPNLSVLDLDYNQLTSLDLSANTNLISLWAFNNELSNLNIQNGNNTNIKSLLVFNNPQLQCIQVDDLNYANSQLCDSPPAPDWCKDETANYSEDCQLSTEDFTTTDFQLFPNPAGNFLNIQFKENIESVKIYSTQGILVKEVASKIIDIAQLNAGMYFAKIIFNGKSFTKKFIKE